MSVVSAPQGSPCPICQTDPAGRTPGMGANLAIDCPRCGAYRISLTAVKVLEDQRWDGDRWKISAWVVQMRPDMLMSEMLDQAVASAVPSLLPRARRLLSALAADTDAKYSVAFGGDRYKRYLAFGWCRDADELLFLLNRVMHDEFGWLAEVKAQPMLRGSAALLSCSLSAKGLMELETGHPGDSKIGFCAMWFSAELMPFYRDVIEQGVLACGYDPLRLDHKEHNNNIHDEIIASIRSAKFVIAEMTGHRGGVYFEAGFAHGLGLPVIYMVQEDDKDNVHFDVQSQNFILWSPADLPDARKRLENRIRATLGQGPLDPARH